MWNKSIKNIFYSIMDLLCYTMENYVIFNTKHLKKKHINQQLKLHIVNKCKEVLVNNDKFTLLVDLSNLQLYHIDMDFITSLTHILKNTFVDKLNCCEIINYPDFFKSCYNVIKNIIDDKTRDKIKWYKNTNDINILYNLI